MRRLPSCNAEARRNLSGERRAGRVLPPSTLPWEPAPGSGPGSQMADPRSHFLTVSLSVSDQLLP